MKKKLTVYCIKYGKAERAFVAIADDSIPLKIINWYTDVDNSFIFESFIELEHLSLMKKVCKDTAKTAILQRNFSDKSIREFIDCIIGNEVTWIDYCFNVWTKSFSGLKEYSSQSESIVEIDHPINLKDKMLNSIIKEGLKSIEKQHKEIQAIRAKIKKRKKKDGK